MKNKTISLFHTLKFTCLLVITFSCSLAFSAVIMVGGNREIRHDKDRDLVKRIAEKNQQTFHDVYGGTPELMKSNFINAIKAAKDKLRPGEPLIIQFTGHGFTSDPRDPKLSGVSTGNQQMVNYDTFAKLILEHGGDSTVKLISSSCFGGGVHHISRELNKLKPGKACSVSATGHTTPANVMNNETATEFTQNFWSGINGNKEANLGELFSKAAIGTGGRNSYNYGLSSMSSTDSIEFFNKTGTHNKSFQEEWSKRSGVSDKPWNPPRGIASWKLDARETKDFELKDKMFQEEFGELDAHTRNPLHKVFKLPHSEAQRWYEKLKKKDHTRKVKKEYVPYVGELIGWKWDVDGGVDINDKYHHQCHYNKEIDKQVKELTISFAAINKELSLMNPRSEYYVYLENLKGKFKGNKNKYKEEMILWKKELETTISDYGKKKMELVDHCLNNIVENQTDFTQKSCENGFEYEGKEEIKEHNKNMSELEKVYREKFDKLRSLEDHQDLADLRFMSGEMKKMKRVLLNLNKIKDVRKQKNINGIFKCETTPLLKS